MKLHYRYALLIEQYLICAGIIGAELKIHAETLIAFICINDEKPITKITSNGFVSFFSNIASDLLSLLLEC